MFFPLVTFSRESELVLANRRTETDFGADVNAKDVYGATPLDWAEEVNEADSAELKAAKKEIADLLRKHELNN